MTPDERYRHKDSHGLCVYGCCKDKKFPPFQMCKKHIVIMRERMRERTNAKFRNPGALSYKIV